MREAAKILERVQAELYGGSQNDQVTVPFTGRKSLVFQ